jgi:hypothetical protein
MATKIMVSRNPERAISTIHHDQKVYTADKKGRFEVDDAHVAVLRSHGLKLDGEPDDPVAQKAADDSEIAKLKARVAELEAKAAKPS